MSESSVATVFKCKEFSVLIAQYVFPVTTDSILLGSWLEPVNVKSVIDLGCGTGILSLMVAQKSSDGCQILAFDKDDHSINCCKENFVNSKWKHRLSSYQLDISLFQSEFRKYFTQNTCDLVISNPPYFFNSLLSTQDSNKRSRHQGEFNYRLLAQISNWSLNDNGKANFVVPVSGLDELTYAMYLNKFHLHRKTKVYHTRNNLCNIVLVEFGRKSKSLRQQDLVLFNLDGYKTNEYDMLTRNFYL